jgi:hypothetical protein
MAHPRSKGLVVAVVILAVGAVLGVLLAGPIFIEKPRWSGGLAAPPPITRSPEPVQTPSGRPDDTMNLVQLIQNALIILGALALLILLLRALMRIRMRLDARRMQGVQALHDAALPAPDGGIIEAPVVRRGIARALAALDDHRDPSDAVVQAWLGFEDAAVAAGAARRPSETPTEYAVRIISRFDADRTAAEELVQVYEDVRFSGRAADAAAVATARRCLLALQASWNDGASRPEAVAQ